MDHFITTTYWFGGNLACQAPEFEFKMMDVDTIHLKNLLVKKKYAFKKYYFFLQLFSLNINIQPVRSSFFED